MGLADKLIFWKKIVAIAVEASARFDLGFWDYVADADRAEHEFDTWTSELEAESATTEAEVGTEVAESLRLTALFLLEKGGNGDLTVADRCDLPEDQWFKRDTFVHLFETIRMLSFASVRADAVYLVPGSAQDGLSFDDVHGGGWEYLKQLS